MAFPDYDYDVYEDFEDALSGSWSIAANPDSNITIPALQRWDSG